MNLFLPQWAKRSGKFVGTQRSTTLSSRLGTKNHGQSLNSYGLTVKEMRKLSISALLPNTERYASVRQAIADIPEEAENLCASAELMSDIMDIIQESGWTLDKAGEHCEMTQPRISKLLGGLIS